MALLNIGLNVVGQSKPMHTNKVLAKVRKLTSIKNYKKVIGEYNGKKEPTLVIEVPKIKKKQVRSLAGALDQECIALMRGSRNHLVYSKGSKAQKNKFDKKQFMS